MPGTWIHRILWTKGFLNQNPQVSGIRGLITPYRQGRRRGHVRWGIWNLMRDHGLDHVSMYVFDLLRVIHRGNRVHCSITAGSLLNLVDHRIPSLVFDHPVLHPARYWVLNSTQKEVHRKPRFLPKH
ncbi:unnamed protein product [Pleuronectes platessa]|uniref:Uncharacterized protein n=1 Tax=Pleuronectes platessa TaxID=8262 RepID=A0A9N7VIM2_PLEPL|nr:unnamed protein product [Pleuronectes platessa]